LHNSNIMVIGYGRIGKVLCKMLSGMGAHVFPVVRKQQDLATAFAYGYNPILLEDLNLLLPDMNIIMNTAPSILIDKSNMKHIDKRCLLIDLASAPHGIDYNAGKAAGLTILYAGSLPGAVAPYTAAKYIQQAIYNAIEEEALT